MTTDPDQRIRAAIIAAAKTLVQDAESLGFNVSITKVSIEPLAMGRTENVIEIWPTSAARKEES